MNDKIFVTTQYIALSVLVSFFILTLLIVSISRIIVSHKHKWIRKYMYIHKYDFLRDNTGTAYYCRGMVKVPEEILFDFSIMEIKRRFK